MRLVLVHGFTQTARSWDPVVAELPPGTDAVALDVPDGLDVAATAAHLGATGGQGTWVGYSMGGRLCLRIALDQPRLVERLVLVSATPGIADPTERRNRREADQALARQVEGEGVDAFLARWLGHAMFATLDREAAGLEERRTNSVARLAHQLRVLGQGAMEPLWDRLGELRMPVTLYTGALDERYVAIAAEMQRRVVTSSTLQVLGGAGHAMHLEDPAFFAHVLAAA